MNSLILKLPKRWTLTDDEFYEFCQQNDNVQLERTAQGEILIMAPTGGNTGNKNIDLSTELTLWNRQTRLGKVFDSSTGFILPNGATRSPDASWIEQSRWDALSAEEQETFPPLCPDFVAELMSKTDSLKVAQAKMDEWMENGCQLGWLFRPKTEEAFIYRPNQPVAHLKGYHQSISGEPLLPGFTFDLAWLGTPV